MLKSGCVGYYVTAVTGVALLCQRPFPVRRGHRSRFRCGRDHRGPANFFNIRRWLSVRHYTLGIRL